MSNTQDLKQNTILEPEVKVEFGGKERTFRVDFNTLALIEERTGKSALSFGKVDGIRMKDLRTIIWATLQDADHSITEQEVGRMLTMSSMPVVMEAFMTCMYISMKGKMPTKEELQESKVPGPLAPGSEIPS